MVNMIDTGEQDSKTELQIFKPDIIDEYNQYIGVVYLVDQVTQAYPSMCKTIKWYKKLFLHMLYTTVCNSFVIWRTLNPGKKYLPGLQTQQHHQPSKKDIFLHTSHQQKRKVSKSPMQSVQVQMHPKRSNAKYVQHAEMFPCVLSFITLVATSRGKIILFDIILITF
jgi:hypothetical protein